MTAVIVGERWTRLTGFGEPRLGDILMNLPEPPFQPGHNFCRSSPANLLALEVHPELSSVDWFDPDNRLFEAKAYRFLTQLRTEEPDPAELAAFPTKMVMDPYQEKPFWYGRRMRAIALAPTALGTGKTKMTLDITVAKFLADEIDGLIVIAPNGVHRQWVTKAVPAHISDKVPYIAHVWKPTTKIPRRWPLDPNESMRRLRIMTFNVEAFSAESGRAVKALAAILATGRFVLAMDESSRIKNGQRKRSRTLIRLAPRAAVRMILTGTPVTKGLENFYAQYAFLDPNIIGLTSYTAFRNRYCVTIPAYRGAAQGAVKIIGYKNKEELFRKLAPVTFMIGKEVLGLGEPLRDRREVEMTPEQREIYTMMAKRMVQDMHANRIATPSNVLVELLRLQQVLSGIIHEPYVDPKTGLETTRERHIETNRPAAIRAVLEDNDGQAVVWARFQHDIDILGDMFSDLNRNAASNGEASRWRHVIYDGRVGGVAERERRIDAFSKGEVDLFLGNPAAGGTGVDGLQEQCSLGIYYNNSFNREHRWQSEGRIYRRGQKERVTYLDLVTPGTVDEMFLDAIESTANLAEMVLRNPSMLTGGLS